MAGPFGSLIERIIEWMDEFYSIRLSQEVRRSMLVNAQRGRLQDAPAFEGQPGSLAAATIRRKAGRRPARLPEMPESM